MSIIGRLIEAINNMAKAQNRIADELANLHSDYSQEISEHGTAIERGCNDIAQAVGELKE